MTAIEIYTGPGCGYCTAAKSLLTRKNAVFTGSNVATDPAYRDQMYDRAGHGSTFPQIFIGATHVGGCDELYALDRAGKLDGLLAGERPPHERWLDLYRAMVQMRTGCCRSRASAGHQLIREAAAQGADYVSPPR